MKKQKMFMPPQGVREAEKLDEEFIPLDGVRKLYGSDKNISMRWARRILRQEKILKTCTHGDVFIPVAVDLQLGPEIFAALISVEVSKVVEKFDEHSLSASCLPFGDGTLAFFVDYTTDEYNLSKAEFPFNRIGNKGMVMIDESKAKIKSIMRAVWKSKEAAGFECYEVSEPSEVAGMSIDKLFLLKSPDISVESTRIIKVDSDLGLVLGWAIISTVDGMPHFDKQGDHIPDQAMLEASTDFMMKSRVSGDMHQKDESGSIKSAGTVVHCWPLTAEIAEAFEISTNKTGLMIAIKPDSNEILQKFKDGTYTGFSIGGVRDPEFTEEVV